MTDEALYDLSVVEARRLLSAGAFDAEHYAARLRHRAVEVAEYNTMTVVVKDSIDVAGTVSTAGTPGLAANTADTAADVVQRLRAAGAHISGKNVMHELALGAPVHLDLPDHVRGRFPGEPCRDEDIRLHRIRSRRPRCRAAQCLTTQPHRRVTKRRNDNERGTRT
ncbi:amidase family protein [Mycolicibacterium sp. 120266]|uniref:amidase family protein n=1 Tax=Mycolicibacterium sp. 120266 TaxID=3090601 RepID=UPI00299CEC6E|nr:amidase family protein [Mycolicibacterium sp. 120266]MDX1876049.1 amidase family protein [Mycolicibacterium sp. 120266]